MPFPTPIYGDNKWLSIIADGLTSTDKTSFTTGSKNSIGSIPLQMTTTSYALRLGVVVKASSVNVGRIYAGDDNTVTQNTNPNLDGFELSAGESVFFPIDNINRVWLVASQSGQKAFWYGI